MFNEVSDNNDESVFEGDSNVNKDNNKPAESKHNKSIEITKTDKIAQYLHLRPRIHNVHFIKCFKIQGYTDINCCVYKLQKIK